MFKSNAQAQEKIAALMEALEELSPGETITYRALSKVAGEDVTGGSWLLQAALRKSEKKTGAVYDNVHAVGYQRLHAKDLPGVGKKANTRVRRVARKARTRFENVRANDLSPGELATLSAYRSHFGMLESIAREQSVKALEAKVEEAPEPVGKIAGDRLGALMGKKRA